MTATDIKRAEHSHIWNREKHEHYLEPDWCSRRLFDVEFFKGTILDPACGIGRIPEAAIAAGHDAAGSDIVDRGYERSFGVLNFLDAPPCLKVDNVVSNPPFDLFRAFAVKALQVARYKVALIWTARTLPAARWLQDTPLARILLLTPRPSMPPGHVIASGEKPGGGKQDFCWLIWDHAHTGPATIGWLHRDGGHR